MIIRRKKDRAYGPDSVSHAAEERRGIWQADSDGQPSAELAIQIRKERAFFPLLSAKEERFRSFRS
jgi:hypothetical protein